MDAYDLVIVGGGTAGLTAASFARGVGADVALIERSRLGGDCTWTGCMPSKTFLSVARVAHEARDASRLGLTIQEPEVDLGSVMAHVRDIVEATYEEETPEALRERH